MSEEKQCGCAADELCPEAKRLQKRLDDELRLKAKLRSADAIKAHNAYYRHRNKALKAIMEEIDKKQIQQRR